MQDLHAAKPMAKALRKALAARNIQLTHSDCLELVAQQFGYAEWNILSAKADLASQPLRVPSGWRIAGDAPHLYEMGVDPGNADGAAIIRSRPGITPNRADFGTLMQSISAGRHRDKRLRLRAELRVEDVSGAGTIWMRIDAGRQRAIRFSNLEGIRDGALTGSTGWTARSIVLDVPPDAESIHYGFLLRGSGCVWCRHIELGEVGGDVPETPLGGDLPDRPVNLDFRQTDHD